MEQDQQRKRRIYPRAKINFRLTFELNGRTISAATADIGYGGALLGTRNPVPVGNEITIEIKSDRRQASTQALVVREHRAGMAVEFIKPTVDFLSALVEMLSPYLSADAWEQLKGGQVIHVDFQTRRRLSQPSIQ